MSMCMYIYMQEYVYIISIYMCVYVYMHVYIYIFSDWNMGILPVSDN